jgi:Fic family protein
MGTSHKERWFSDGSGSSRMERRSGTFYYYLPTPLSRIKVSLEPDVVGDVGRAEQAITKLNGETTALHSSEGIARLLLRAEAVSSSYIEGLSIGARRLLKAEMNLIEKDSFRHDEGAVEVIGNIHAMAEALDAAQTQDRITVDTILGIHKMLCNGTRIEKYGGIVRDEQNWVGGNSYNPLNADYIPPAPQYVPDLLKDLSEFCNDTIISPVVQAALVHAQFETIHPFADGNGRTGRALIHLILRKRGLTPNLVPPISLIMATHAKSYIHGLTEYRFLDSDDKGAIQEGFNDWVSFFAGACLSACEEAVSFEDNARLLQEVWREKLSSVRKNSALDLLLGEMVGMPVFSIATASSATGRVISSVTSAIERCIEAGIVKPMGSQRRNRIFEVPEVINDFNIFERKLASSIGNTEIAEPVRAVPKKLKGL